MAGSSSKEEPRTAPEPERWYNLTLGSSFADHRHSPKFCTLRCEYLSEFKFSCIAWCLCLAVEKIEVNENIGMQAMIVQQSTICIYNYVQGDEFKPASIDKNQPGSLHRNKDNRVSVEFQNNQHGKPKLMFEGISEDYKENDAVLFFDGETFRLEQLHRAVKRLRHVRMPGESAPTTATPMVASNASVLESGSPTLGKGTKFQSLNKDISNSVEMERIDINKPGSLDMPTPPLLGGGKTTSVSDVDPSSSQPNLSTASSDPKNYELEEQIDILDDSDDDGYKTIEKRDAAEREFTTGIDINVPHQVDMDDEMADVDVSGDEAESGPNAAEALRAQVNAEGRGNHTSSSSSSSSSSGSGSSESESGSGSASSSSDTESGDGDGDSINSI